MVASVGPVTLCTLSAPFKFTPVKHADFTVLDPQTDRVQISGPLYRRQRTLRRLYAHGKAASAQCHLFR